MRVLQYWAARTAVFFVAVAVLYVLGWWDLVALIAAFVLAWLVGYIAFPTMRERAAVQLAEWMERSRQAHRDADAEEDAHVDRAASRGQGDPSAGTPDQA